MTSWGSTKYASLNSQLAHHGFHYMAPLFYETGRAPDFVYFSMTLIRRLNQAPSIILCIVQVI